MSLYVLNRDCLSVFDSELLCAVCIYRRCYGDYYQERLIVCISEACYYTY